QRSYRRVGVSTAARSFSSNARLGYVAGCRSKAGFRSTPVRALAVLEGIRHWRSRRSARPPRQRHDVCAWHQRAAEAHHGHGRNPVPGKEPALEGVTYRSDSWDDEKPHLWNFFQAVRSRKPVVEDAVFGHNAALACHLANESYFRRSAMYWDAASKSIKT